MPYSNCLSCHVICLQQHPQLPHRSQQWPATRPAPRTLSVAFWVSVQLLMWGRGRGTKVSTSICQGEFLHFRINHTIQCKQRVSKYAGLLTLVAYSCAHEAWRPQHIRILIDVCVCVFMCNLRGQNQTSSFRNPCLFTVFPQEVSWFMHYWSYTLSHWINAAGLLTEAWACLCT